MFNGGCGYRKEKLKTKEYSNIKKKSIKFRIA